MAPAAGSPAAPETINGRFAVGVAAAFCLAWYGMPHGKSVVECSHLVPQPIRMRTSLVGCAPQRIPISNASPLPFGNLLLLCDCNSSRIDAEQPIFNVGPKLHQQSQFNIVSNAHSQVSVWVARGPTRLDLPRTTIMMSRAAPVRAAKGPLPPQKIGSDRRGGVEDFVRWRGE